MNGGDPWWVAALAALGALLSALGYGKWIEYRIRRREQREVLQQKRADDQAAERREISAIDAEANADTLKLLLEQMKQRIDSYEGMIRTLREDYGKDIAELKAENRLFDRQVRDLQAALRDWQLGNKVPRGQVLLPIREVRAVRERAPGILSSSWYPGEDIAEDPSIVARITPLPPPELPK